MINKALSLRLDLYFFILFVAIALLMRFTANPAPSIVAFEFAGSLDGVDALFRQWGPEGQALARRSLYLDFLFILAYTVFLALLCFRAYRWSLHRWLPYSLIAAIAALQFVAGLLDVGENLCLLRLLDGSRAEWLAPTARWLASIKFSFVGIGIVAIITGRVAALSSPNGR
ncbi:MAG: hypothetical protein KDC66_23115 [Phaeodactylibacter sp.]|nr:hypothetical protein [Phaeodactylibacter sp.]MCB9276943.1 hypothetical protein [Lewinellaceae bacterium]